MKRHIVNFCLGSLMGLMGAFLGLFIYLTVKMIQNGQGYGPEWSKVWDGIGVPDVAHIYTLAFVIWPVGAYILYHFIPKEKEKRARKEAEDGRERQG